VQVDVFALAKLQRKYGIDYIKYLFAKQGQFKCCCDSYGFTYKHFQTELEKNGFHASNAKDIAIQMIEHKHKPKVDWASLENSDPKSPKMLTKRPFSADNFFHGLVSPDPVDKPKEGAILFAPCERGSRTRNFNITSIPHCRKQYAFYMNLSDQTNGVDVFKYQSANLPVTCNCDGCRTFDFCDSGRKGPTIQSFTLKECALNAEQRKNLLAEGLGEGVQSRELSGAEKEAEKDLVQERRKELEEEDLSERIVCVASDNAAGWSLGRVSGDRISNGAAVFWDPNSPEADESQLDNPVGISTDKGSHVVSMILFKERTSTFYYHPGRRAKEKDYPKASLIKRLKEDEVSWTKPGGEFTITEEVLEQIETALEYFNSENS
jgi:hypothetical protein